MNPRSIPFGRPITGDEEKQAVCAVIDSGMMAHGPNIDRFEEVFAEFTGAARAVAVANCTAGLHLAYFSLGIGPGDEVIVPAQTHVATAHAVELMGAKPVFVDAEGRTGNIDIAQIEAAITSRTRAISLVHFLGMPVDMVPLMAIARKHDLKVVEDCALAIGSYVDGVHCGLLGDVGCYSFYPVKHITTAEGGMMITRHGELADNLTLQRAFGVDRHVGQRKVPGEYDVPMLGFNYRMNECEAAMGICQMARLPEFLTARKRNYEQLDAGLREAPGITVLESSTARLQSSYYCHTMILNDNLAPKRLDIIKALKGRGVGTSIYYPKAVPLLTYYAEKYGYKAGDFPQAERISNQTIALPVGPHVSPDDVDYIVAMVHQTLKEAL